MRPGKESAFRPPGAHTIRLMCRPERPRGAPEPDPPLAMRRTGGRRNPWAARKRPSLADAGLGQVPYPPLEASIRTPRVSRLEGLGKGPSRGIPPTIQDMLQKGSDGTFIEMDEPEHGH